MNELDRIILEHAPLVAAPRYGVISGIAMNTHRYVIAEDGLWLDLRRPWLDLRHRIAESEVPLPYGPVRGFALYAFAEEDVARIERRFIEDAIAALPNEFAAWAVWNANTRSLVYRPLTIGAANPGSVTFERPTLADHESLAIDMHSHGAMPAFFSAQDDADDAGEVKLSFVCGNLGDSAGEITGITRLCALGLFIPGAQD